MDLVVARGISKYYASTETQANDGIDFLLRPGEIHALIGENGAGKSTLARVAAGLETQDSGEVLVRGVALRRGRRGEAERLGVGLVPQSSVLAPSLSVAENLVLGREPRRLGVFVDRRRALYDAAMLVERYGFRLDPGARVSELSPAELKTADILRALARGAEAVFLDEPTSILTEGEASHLFELLRTLRDSGKGIVLISHRLAEVMALADRVTVLRRGRVVAELEPSQTSEQELAALASNAEPKRVSRAHAKPGETRFELIGATRRNAGRETLSGLSLTLRAGEILGIAALAGNGLDALEELASGEAAPDAGRALHFGQKLNEAARGEARRSRLAYMPTDREAKGLALGASVADNALARGEAGRAAPTWMGRRERHAAAERLVGFFGLSGVERRAAALSGGNRQRLLAARELSGQPDLLVAANPSQGLDARARSELWARLTELAEHGAAILLLTSNVEELLTVATRVAVLYRGRLRFLEGPVGALAPETVSEALGGSRQAS